jgi:hypothetical protein
MGRWLSPDWSSAPTPIPHATLLDPRTLNLYSYVRNNPLKYTDEDGHKDSVKYAESISCGNDSCLLYQKKTEVKDIKDADGNVTGQKTTETITYATYDMSGERPTFQSGTQTTNTRVRDAAGNTTARDYGQTQRIRDESIVLPVFGGASRVYDTFASAIRNDGRVRFGAVVTSGAVAAPGAVAAGGGLIGAASAEEAVSSGVDLLWEVLKEIAVHTAVEKHEKKK